MTTKVKVIHAGGNHKVKVQEFFNADASGDPKRETVLEKEGDEFEQYVHSHCSLKVVEADD